MKSPYRLVKLLFAAFFIFITLTTPAQFKKPLSSPRDRVSASEAKWNVGVLGGPNFTAWFHFYGDKASNYFLQDYKTFDSITHPYTESIGYFGGIGVERMLKSNFSVGLNVVYAQHKVKLGYMDNHFPYAWGHTINDTIDRILFGQIVKEFTANYRTIEAYVPFTYYFGLASTKNIKPYIYFAPRISYILPIKQNKMTYSAKYYDVYGKTPIVITDTLKDSSGSPIHDQDNNIQIDTLTFFPTSNNQVPFNGSAYRKLNVGGTIGIGSLFRFNISNYYILIKFDVSANMNALMTLKQGQIINNDFNHLRYSADAHATLTFMLPIKKPLQDACIRWGKYK